MIQQSNFRRLLVLAFCFCASPALFPQQLYFPPLSGGVWESVTPASLGWRQDRIDSLYAFLAGKNTKAFLVLKDGRIVLEKYFGQFTADSNWYWASAGKTLTAFLTGIAAKEGYLALSDSTSKYLARGWTSLPAEKERLITVRHQLTMTSGLRDNVSDPYCTLPSCLLYQADAGSRWAYHNAPYTLLDKVIENATGQNFNLYFNSRVRSRIGMNGGWLPSGYNNVYYSTPRSVARFGILMLNKGIWVSDTLIRDTAYYRAMVNTSQTINNSYGYLWWLNGKTSFMLPQTQIVFNGFLMPDAPPDMYSALGKNGQFLCVVPSQKLLLIRMGNAPDTTLEVPTVFCNDIWKKLNAAMGSVSVSEEKLIPGGIELRQNYPNPFNPSTNISFSLPVNTLSGAPETPVRLVVYDILGNTAAMLLDKNMPPGVYSVPFDGSSLPAGFYIYALTVNGKVFSRAMLLLK